MARDFILELRSDRFSSVLILEQVDHRHGERLGCLDHSLVSDRHASAGNNGPGMPRGVDRGCCYREVQRRDVPADVADV